MNEELDGADTAAEADRIMRVYRACDTPARRRLYGSAQPGNRAMLDERLGRMRRVLERASLGDLRGRRFTVLSSVLAPARPGASRRR